MEISSFPDASATSWMPSYVGLWTMDQAAPAQRAYVVSTSMPQPLRESASRRGRPRAHAASVLHTQAGTGASATAFLAPCRRACPPPLTPYPHTRRAVHATPRGAWTGIAGRISPSQQLIQEFRSGLSGVSTCGGEMCEGGEEWRPLTRPGPTVSLFPGGGGGG